jgi:peptidoglycan/LPS O-acetylase OafA/YrhL
MAGDSHVRLKGLDGLRAISILAVIALHLGENPWIVHHSEPPHFIKACFYFKALLNRGGIGVLVFFVISGFLITWLLLNEEESTGKIDLKAFYIRRCLRILPPAYFFLIVIRLLAYTDWAGATWWDVTKSALFFRDYSQGGSSDTAHFWSLAVEEQFYFFWPLCLVMVRNTKARMSIVLALIVGVVSWRLFGGVLHPSAWYQDRRLETVGNQIMTGCLLALLTKAIRPGTLHRLLSGKTAAVIGGALFMVSMTKAVWQTPIGIAVGSQVAATGVAIVLYFLISSHDTLFDRMMDAGWIVWIGRLSYSLYLWQMPFCYSLQGVGWARTFPINIALSFAMAAFSFYLVERPALNLRNRIMGRKHPSTANAAALVPIETVEPKQAGI